MKIKFGILSLIAGIILASCSTGNDVVSGRGIQKRKYNDGYYISWKNNNGKSETDNKESVKNSSEENLAENKSENLKTNIQPENEKRLSYIVETGNEDFILTQEELNTENESNEISSPLVVTKPGIRAMTIKPGRLLETATNIKKVSENFGASGDVMLILLVILCFILPPLAVFLFEGASSRFWIDLILFIIGIAVVGWLLNGLSGLALLVSVIFALLIVLGVI